MRALRHITKSEVETAKYTIFKDQNRWYARNGETGNLEFNSRSPESVIQTAIDYINQGLIVVKGLDPSEVNLTQKSGVQVVFNYYGLTKWGFNQQWKEFVVTPNAGWGTDNAGSGGIVPTPTYIYSYTGVAAGSRGLAYAYTYALNRGDIARYYIDWTKRLEFSFILLRLNSDSEVETRIQLKEAVAEGILAERGIGISTSNYAMVGEAYGSARDTLSLGTLTDNRVKHIRIVKKRDCVEYWVERELIGTLTGTAVPYIKGDAVGYIVISAINGVTGGVDARIQAGNIRILQEI